MGVQVGLAGAVRWLRREQRRWAAVRPWVADTLLASFALGIWALSLPYLSDLQPDAVAPRVSLLGIVLAVANVVPIALRRITPLLAVGICCALSVLTGLSGLVGSTDGLAFLVLLYTIASRLPWRQAIPAQAALLAALTIIMLQSPSLYRAGDWVVNGLTFAAIVLLGRSVHQRRRRTVELENRARAAEADREVALRAAVLQERRRIARELHDVVAHHVSVVVVLAAGARRMIDRDRVAADEALTSVETTGRLALREMRRLLDVLRADGDTDGSDDADSLVPQPGTAALKTLIMQVREAGLVAELDVSGQVRDLDPGVDLAVYRVVQEALTNAIKHAGPAALVRVQLKYGRDCLWLRVADDGRGPIPGGPPLVRSFAAGAAAEDTGAQHRIGHGMVGMRERVAMLGGTFRSGPAPGGGFVVSAEIPLDGIQPRTQPAHHGSVLRGVGDRP